MNRLLILLAVLAMSLAIEPPVYNYSYKINFDESFIQNKTTFRVNGQFIYDPANNRERVDRTNGRYDLFCGSVLPNQTTPCNQIVVDSKRWLVFPAKSSCCFCCDASHGCGILRPDWLNGAEYLGQEKLIDTLYNKWSKPGSFGYNYFWTTTDENQIPRKLDENGDHLSDFNTHSFHNQTVPFPDGTFALPSYCNVDEPSNCPIQTACGEFRSRAKTA